ncbi:hypothetical protein AmaxDRAFT_0372 [Limnospira maxima CS-328]|uniref:Uncharacterized protein n=1 Tax=Limnospira maxima CS-328 TaxID=513049 RepID=B5VV38_LIMMA|nr:hypothetical protein [Limnospira sp. PMC 737.11]EDZ96883.1 hypothetical protein AmaxDRAFT_0372 [Limnospira maxima CS-328]MDC0837606.1 hypothetical protein [Limnoraphis robusta]MDT9233486.1 hypothetical protein [Limnospira sp. PMC 917.15]
MAIAVLRQAQIFRLGLRESASDATQSAGYGTVGHGFTSNKEYRQNL